MKHLSQLRCLLFAVLLPCMPTFAKPLSCPAVAPLAWGLGKVRLESVRVLSYPAAAELPASGPLPIMAPDNEIERRGILIQSWHMNNDAPRYTFKFDCLYADTDRYLRIDAPIVKRCTSSSSKQKKTFSFNCR